MKKVLFTLIAITACLVSTSCTRAFHKWNAERVGDIIEYYEVESASNRLYNYQWFFDQYNQIKATAANVKLLDGDDKKGTLMVLNSMIAEYNSRSAQERNRGKYKDDALPDRIELSDVYSE
jgi:hypothetical protein